MSILEIFKWWWENNIEWIRLNDPWVIPVVAISLPLSFLLRAIAAIIRVWRGK